MRKLCIAMRGRPVVHTWKSIIIGGAVPALALLVVMPLLANTSVSIAGIPLLFAYVFALCPFTTLCLWIAWRIDEPRYREGVVAHGASAATEGHGD